MAYFYLAVIVLEIFYNRLGASLGTLLSQYLLVAIFSLAIVDFILSKPKLFIKKGIFFLVLNLLLVNLILTMIAGADRLGYFSLLYVILIIYVLFFLIRDVEINATLNLILIINLALLFLTFFSLITNDPQVLTSHPVRSAIGSFFWGGNRLHSFFIAPGIFGFIATFTLLLGALNFPKSRFLSFIIYFISYTFVVLADSKAAIVSGIIIATILFLYNFKIKYLVTAFLLCALLIGSINNQAFRHRLKIWSDFYSKEVALLKGLGSINSPSPPVSQDPSPPVSQDPSPPVSQDPSLPVSHGHNFLVDVFKNIDSVGIDNKYMKIIGMLLISVRLAVSVLMFWLLFLSIREKDKIGTLFLGLTLIYSMFDYGYSWTHLNLFTFNILFYIAFKKIKS